MSRTIIELSLCGRCAGVFYHSPTHRIKRVDPLQVIKEECMCCRIRAGYDYSVAELPCPPSIICPSLSPHRSPAIFH